MPDNSGFSNILVCFDCSKQSKHALTKAITLAEQFNSHLSILMVIEENQIDFWNDTEFKSNAHKSQIHLKHESRIYQQAEKILNNITKRIPDTINYKTKILTGDPSKVIINYSKRTKPDVIIMGSRGLTGFPKLLIGSVSSEVVEHASSSVLVIR